VDTEILLAGEVRLTIHLLDGKHAVKELQTLKWMITNEILVNLGIKPLILKTFTSISINFLAQVDWKESRTTMGG
jgi:hypothetical protein